MKFFIESSILLSAVLVACVDHTVVPSDLFLDIDGISIAPSIIHICTLEVQPKVEIGGKLKCWGSNTKQIKSFESDDSYVQVVSGLDFVCSIKLDQSVDCWGNIQSKVPGLFTQISAASHHVCGILTNGRISCWGFREFNIPSHFNNESFVQISCSKHHCCAIDTYAYVHCFGAGQGGGAWNERTAPKHAVDNPDDSNSLMESDRVETGIYFDGYDEDDEEEEKVELKSSSSDANNKKSMTQSSSSSVIEEEDYDEYEDEEEEENMIQDVKSVDNNVTSSSSMEALAEQQAAAKAIIAEAKLKRSLINEKELLNQNRQGFIQFRQISVGEDYSCGITLLNSNVLCWGKDGLHYDMPRNITGPIKQVSVNKIGVCVIYDSNNNNHPSSSSSSLQDVSREGELECWGAVAIHIHHLKKSKTYHHPPSKSSSTSTPTTTAAAISHSNTMENIEMDISSSGGSSDVVIDPINGNDIIDPVVMSGESKWQQVRVGHGTSLCAVNLQSELYCWGTSHIRNLAVPSGLLVL